MRQLRSSAITSNGRLPVECELDDGSKVCGMRIVFGA
jgi:hypothetical protein